MIEAMRHCINPSSANSQFSFPYERNHKRRPVSPDTVNSICRRDLVGVFGIPAIFGHADLVGGGIMGERWQWWASHFGVLTIEVLGLKTKDVSKVYKLRTLLQMFEKP